ncbi:MAG TPA: FtsX-like permease family protein [Myxococcaceae bacterium]|nr:FtsX-like permease family protein [Myxococcaceae bacterium]
MRRISRREIGVRAAVGATSKDFQIQFLGEAALLCLMGSVLGVVLALTGGSLLDRALGWAVVPTLPSVGVSVGIASLVGWLPASTRRGWAHGWIRPSRSPASAENRGARTQCGTILAIPRSSSLT